MLCALRVRCVLCRLAASRAAVGSFGVGATWLRWLCPHPTTLTMATHPHSHAHTAATAGVDWRAKLENQRGAVLATELKNNANKMAKWTAAALVA